MLFSVASGAVGLPNGNVRSAAALAAPRVSSSEARSKFCARGPPLAPASDKVVSQVCGRCDMMTCLAEEDRSLETEPELAYAKCCDRSARPERFELDFMRYPREHVEMARGFCETTEKTVDYNFMGTVTSSGRRDWVKSFVLSHFTNSSMFVDTAPALWKKTPLSAYETLGPFDHTLERLPKAFVQHADAGYKSTPCGHARTDPAYLEDMARTKFVLCPRGDHPWSMRFFEAIMSRAIPIVDDDTHIGRNPAERGLGYYYLMRQEVEAMLPTEPEYCPEWAEHNMRIFLHHQAYGGALNEYEALASDETTGAHLRHRLMAAKPNAEPMRYLDVTIDALANKS